MRIWCLWPLGLLCCGTNSQDRRAAPGNDGGLLVTEPIQTCPSASVSAPPPLSTCVSTQQRDFSTDILPLFASCSGEICHDFSAASLKATVGLPSAECCNERQLIAARLPEHSYLLDKLRGQNLCNGARMPLNKPPLSDDDVQAISDWICQGAPVP